MINIAEVLPHLRCPICREPLAESLRIHSVGCKRDHYFAVTDGVPELLWGSGRGTTKDSFDFKWKKVPGYGYDPATESFRRKWYLERYGWTEKQFSKYIASCGMVLDVGTGLGSQVQMYAQQTKGKVFGVDISLSVHQAARRLRQLSNIMFMQADLNYMPFEHDLFDFIASDQVLHHTPDTKKALFALLPFLKQAGQIAFYVYKRKCDARENTDDLLRKHTTAMSEQECWQFSQAVTMFGKELAELNLDMQRELYWKGMKCFWNPDFDLKTNVMVNFDWYHPRFAWRHTVEEVQSWLEEAGLTVLHMDTDSQSGISVRAIKQ